MGDDPPQAVAAALVAAFEEDGQARVVLIRRATGLALNPGEMAFPGGKVEPGEAMVDAALREATEEVGLDPSAVEVVGWLDRVTGRQSGSVVLPVVGLLQARPVLIPAAAEVDEVSDIALSALLSCCSTEVWGERDMYFFEAGQDIIWGLTARVLYQLLCRLTERTAPPGPAPAPAPGGTSPPAPS
ncbi:MAG: NUDIX hydrolase [Acidimicrobiales bacterium]